MRNEQVPSVRLAARSRSKKGCRHEHAVRAQSSRRTRAKAAGVEPRSGGVYRAHQGVGDEDGGTKQQLPREPTEHAQLIQRRRQLARGSQRGRHVAREMDTTRERAQLRARELRLRALRVRGRR
eukprot:192694-Prymnesium_polylepis.2